MIRIKRILCPSDLSEGSARAFHHALVLGRWYGAEIIALHVNEVPMFGVFDPLGATTSSLGARAGAQAWLDGAAEWARRDGLTCSVAIRDGSPATEIADAAEALDVDLIVLGTHGRKGMTRWFLGSVAEKVLRIAPCPVLTVVPPSEYRSPSAPLKQVLCAVDFSASSSETLAHALSIAQESAAALTVLHVLEGEPFIPLRKETSDEADQMRSERDATALHRLRSAIPASVHDWCNVTARVRWGKPYEQILEEAAEIVPDVIVIGVSGASALEYGLFGSTANQVVRGSPCPVLTVRARKGLGGVRDLGVTALSAPPPL